MMVRSIGQLLADKSAFCVSPEESIEAVAVKMANLDERAAAVVANDQIVGIISEKDIVHSCVAKGADPKHLNASQIMTRAPVTVDADASAASAIEKMLAGGFHHLPVVKSGKYEGIICTDDTPEEYQALLEHFKELRTG